MTDLDDFLGRVKPWCVVCDRKVTSCKVGRYVERSGFGGQSTQAYCLRVECHGKEQQLVLDPAMLRADFIEQLRVFGDKAAPVALPPKVEPPELTPELKARLWSIRPGRGCA